MASIEHRNRRWHVRWREPDRRHPSKSFASRREAERFRLRAQDAEDTGRSLNAELARGSMPFHAFARDWFRSRRPDWSERTATSYDRMLRAHIMTPELRDKPLRALSYRLLAEWWEQLDTGPAMRARLRTLVSQMLEEAVRRDHIDSNPARYLRLPRGARQRKRAPVILEPGQVERLREVLDEHGRPGDSALVSTIAYGGLRPSEALALVWGDFDGSTVAVRHSLDREGRAKATKTGRSRHVRLPAPCALDLELWRPDGSHPERPVFPRRDGQHWRETDLRNWRRRVFQPAAELAGLPAGLRPYDLRHLAASLRVQSGENLPSVAYAMGHGVDMLLATYTHLIDRYRDMPARPVADAISEAR